MNLAAKASTSSPPRTVRGCAGYAMAALLVGMAVMAIMLSVAMPTWSNMIRRDKEEELLFRGTQYARAINKYQQKFANASPASLDVLIEQRLLRKKFRDPLSPNKDGEFQMLYLSTQAPGSRGGGMGPGGSPGTVGGTGGGVGGGTARGSGTGSGSGRGAGSGAASGTGPGEQSGTTYSTTPSGGIVGVASKNTGQSIRIYKGKKRYNEWEFVGMEQSTAAGPGGGAGGAGPQRGGPGGAGGPGGPGGRGGGRDGGFGGRGGQGQGGSGGFGSGGAPGRGSGSSPQR